MDPRPAEGEARTGRLRGDDKKVNLSINSKFNLGYYRKIKNSPNKRGRHVDVVLLVVVDDGEGWSI